jgi:Ca-activated chloride channel family protein
MWQQLPDLLGSVEFLHPGWLWATPLSLVAIALLLHRDHLDSLASLPRLYGNRRFRHPRVALLRTLETRSHETKRARGRAWRWMAYAVTLVGLHLALAQPYRLGQQLPEPPRYRDTVFLVDTSITMVLRDYLVGGERVDRMTMLKSVLTHFINRLEGNRISVIAYSEQAYTLVPLTADYDLLKVMIRRLQPAILTGRTSDVGRGLLYALQQLERERDGNVSQRPVLVLVSDVDRSNRDLDPRAVAAALAERGYRLHSIGIGAASSEAREAGYRGLIYYPANFTFLRDIATSGGGRFFWADSTDSLGAALQAIQAQEKRSVTTEPRYLQLPLYQWPLLAALAWLVIVQLWPEQRRT